MEIQGYTWNKETNIWFKEIDLDSNYVLTKSYTVEQANKILFEAYKFLEEVKNQNETNQIQKTKIEENPEENNAILKWITSNLHYSSSTHDFLNQIQKTKKL